MSAREMAVVGDCEISRVEGKKTWQAVSLNGVLLGYVSTRLAGQFFRTVEASDWMFAASDWSSTDPAHAYAVVALIQHVAMQLPQIGSGITKTDGDRENN